MKQKIRLTEGDLHRIVKESVQRILNEIGDSYEKPVDQGGLGLPKGAGKTYLAARAAQKARGLGRNYQADNFRDYGADNFNQNYATYGPNGEDFRLSTNGNLYYGNGIYPTSNDTLKRDPDAQRRAETLRNKVRSYTNNMKAGPRNKIRNGLDAYDAINGALYNQPK